MFRSVSEGIVCSDLNGRITDANKAALRMFYYDHKEDAIGHSRFEYIAKKDHARIKRNIQKTLTDSIMLRIEYSMVRKDGSRFPGMLHTNVLRDDKGDAIGFVAVVRDITESKKAERDMAQSYTTLRKTLSDAINTMAKIVEMRDPYTAGHQQRVAQLAAVIAGELGFDASQIEQIRMAAAVHDIGKIYVPLDILNKPGKLSALEHNLIQTHPKGSYDIVKGMDFPNVIAKYILQHHERLDGSGYPEGLAGKDIVIEAKILAIADVVEAMASHRPYRAALGIDRALEEITQNKRILYDSKVVEACLRLFREKKFEFEIES